MGAWENFIGRAKRRGHAKYKHYEASVSTQNNAPTLSLVHYGTEILSLNMISNRGRTGGFSVSDQAAIRKTTGRGIPRKNLGQDWQF